MYCYWWWLSTVFNCIQISNANSLKVVDSGLFLYISIDDSGLFLYHSGWIGTNHPESSPEAGAGAGDSSRIIHGPWSFGTEQVWNQVRFKLSSSNNCWATWDSYVANIWSTWRNYFFEPIRRHSVAFEPISLRFFAEKISLQNFLRKRCKNFPKKMYSNFFRVHELKIISEKNFSENDVPIISEKSFSENDVPNFSEKRFPKMT